MTTNRSIGLVLVEMTPLYSTFTVKHTPLKQNKGVGLFSATYYINLLQRQMNTFKTIKLNQGNEKTSTGSLTQIIIFFKGAVWYTNVKNHYIQWFTICRFHCKHEHKGSLLFATTHTGLFSLWLFVFGCMDANNLSNAIAKRPVKWLFVMKLSWVSITAENAA